MNLRRYTERKPKGGGLTETTRDVWMISFRTTSSGQQDRNEDICQVGWDTRYRKPHMLIDVPICPNRLPAWQRAGREGRNGAWDYSKLIRVNKKANQRSSFCSPDRIMISELYDELKGSAFTISIWRWLSLCNHKFCMWAQNENSLSESKGRVHLCGLHTIQGVKRILTGAIKYLPLNLFSVCKHFSRKTKTQILKHI